MAVPANKPLTRAAVAYARLAPSFAGSVHCLNSVASRWINAAGMLMHMARTTFMSFTWSGVSFTHVEPMGIMPGCLIFP